jgi:hypothetical protein
MTRLIILATLVLAVTGNVFAYDILCAVCDISGYQTGFISALSGEDDMDTVDYWDIYNTGTPTEGDLTPYDGVMTWSNYAYPDPSGWGDVLADYVDAGGKVVIATFAYGGIAGCAVQGDIADSPYSPFTPSDYTYSSGGTTLDSNYDEPGHPIVEGVTTQPSCNYFNTGRPLTTGASLVAHWMTSDNAVGYNANADVVGFTGYPGQYGSWCTGDYSLIVRNAFVWMIEYGVPGIKSASLGEIKASFR